MTSTSADPPALPGFDTALANAIAACPSTHETFDVPLDDADGMVLARTIIADRDVPPFNRAQMDGYALRHAEYTTTAPMDVVGMIAAGQPADIRIPAGACIAIATGAPVPEDADTVVPHEWSDRGTPVRFTRPDVKRGHAIHPCGADARAGDVIVPDRTHLLPQHLALAATVGLTRVTVIRPPRIIVLTSGDEVRPLGASVAPHQIRNSNGILIVRLVHRLGALSATHAHLPDDRQKTIDTVGHAIETADIVITIGGVSAGDRDFFPSAFEAHGIDMALRGAAIQPGKPICIGRAPRGTIVIGLPGNPVSALVTACLFAGPIIRQRRGDDPTHTWRTLTLREAVRTNAHREVFRPGCAHEDGTVTIPPWAGSGDLAHTAATTGIIALPKSAEPI
ncbi:MAG: molybdopterin molybdotransferase MoeA, partial [Phycisphaerales bacterium]|nr:molybdopterin molybdotransferase MoeA [Phycisphaerales bacterium]